MRYADGAVNGVTAKLVCSLKMPHKAPGLTPAECVALRYADLLATNHLAIDNERPAKAAWPRCFVLCHIKQTRSRRDCGNGVGVWVAGPKYHGSPIL